MSLPIPMVIGRALGCIIEHLKRALKRLDIKIKRVSKAINIYSDIYIDDELGK
jgi:hypothetical protein